MKIDQIVFPEMRVASVRRVGPYGPGVGEAFCKLVSWAGKNNLFDGNTLMLGAYWDCPKLTPPEQCRMDACITLSPGANPKLEEGLAIQTLPGGLCATYLCSVYNNDFRECWDEFSTWLEVKEAQRDQRPCYEIYYGPCAEKHPLKKWVIDIVIPLKHQIT